MSQRKTFAEYSRDYRKRKADRERHNALCAYVVGELATCATLADARGRLRLPRHDESDDVEIVRALMQFLNDKKGAPIK